MSNLSTDNKVNNLQRIWTGKEEYYYICEKQDIFFMISKLNLLDIPQGSPSSC